MTAAVSQHYCLYTLPWSAMVSVYRHLPAHKVRRILSEHVTRPLEDFWELLYVDTHVFSGNLCHSRRRVAAS
jgi:hypothetical protein